MAGDISKLSVVLTANAGGLVSGLKGGETAMNSLGTTAQRVGGILSGWTGILGAVGLGFSLWAGFAKAGEAEQSVATLDAVVRSTGEAAGFTGEQLQKMAGDLAGVTTFSKGAVTSAEAVLATFTNIRGDQFKQAMTAAANLSTVLKQDLQTSVTQIGKALNDPEKGFTALKKAGVSFTQSQIDQIKTLQQSGDILGAQKIILSELEHEYGGAAEAAGGTFSNQIDKAKGAVSSIAAVIAEGMMPALAGFANLVKQAANWVKEHKDQLHALGKGILVVIGAIAAYKTVMFAISAAQKAWNAIQAISLALQGPKGWAILAGAALVGAGAYLAVSAANDKASESMGEANAHMAKAREQMAGMGEDGEEGADGINATGKAAKELEKHIASVTQRLKEQVETFGMNSHEAEVYKLKMEGATDAQLAQVDALAKTLEGLDAQKKAVDEQKRAFEEMANEAKKIIEDIKDPFEKLNDKLAEINKLERAGLLTADQADKASAKVADDFTKGMKFANKVKQFDYGKNAYGEKTGALERRFTKGFPAEQTSAMQKILKEQQRQTKAAEKTAKNTDKLASKPDEVVTIGA